MVKTRKPSLSIVARNATILERIEALKVDQPYWGYRRVWAYLKYRDGMKTLSKNRVYRLMKLHRLLAHQTKSNKAKRTEKSKPRSMVPDTLWGMDMTKVMVDSWGWVYLHVVVDWASKKLVGWHLSTTSKTKDWRVALDHALNRQFPYGKPREHELKLVTDNGCQPTSTSFLKDCSVLGITQIFTSYNNPRGNADTERFIRSTKEGCVWLQEWYSFEQLKTALNRWFNLYNGDYPHSAIGHLTPLDFESKINREKQSQPSQSSS